MLIISNKYWGGEYVDVTKIQESIRKGSDYRLMREAGLSEDAEVCLVEDIFNVVPKLDSDKIINALKIWRKR